MSFERRNRARNSLSSYFVSTSSRSFTSRRLLGFVTRKNSRISISLFVRSAISFCFTCGKSKVQRLIARNRRFRFKLKFKADRVQLKMAQRTIVVNQFTAAYLIEFTAEPECLKTAHHRTSPHITAHHKFMGITVPHITLTGPHITLYRPT